MNKNLVSTFSERLKECLDKETSITATTLAEKIGMSKQAISMYMSGNRNPKRPTIKAIAEILKVDEAWLMGFDVPMRSISSEKIESDDTMAYTQDMYTEGMITNPDIRLIARAGHKMTPEQAEQLRRYAEFMFPEAFDDSTSKK